MNKPSLPTRFHIGTQKAGSTFLYNLLASHPTISLSEQSEVHYYHKYFNRGEDWYLNLFKKEGAMIDTSPKYFMNGEIVAPRIKESIGDEAKFLLILRNPIDLINSHFQMHVVSGHFKRHPSIYPVVPKNVIDCVHRYPDYLKQAQYHTILVRDWLKYFKLNQFKIIIFEDFVNNTNQTTNEILSFWGLPIKKLKSYKVSSNKMLRTRFLFHLRSMLVKFLWLKNLIKKSTFFNFVYEKFLTVNSYKRISASERRELARLLEGEVRSLRVLLDNSVDSWTDFKKNV